jgi:hypothetical protein
MTVLDTEQDASRIFRGAALRREWWCGPLKAFRTCRRNCIRVSTGTDDGQRLCIEAGGTITFSTNLIFPLFYKYNPFLNYSKLFPFLLSHTLT